MLKGDVSKPEVQLSFVFEHHGWRQSNLPAPGQKWVDRTLSVLVQLISLRVLTSHIGKVAKLIEQARLACSTLMCHRMAATVPNVTSVTVITTAR